MSDVSISSCHVLGSYLTKTSAYTVLQNHQKKFLYQFHRKETEHLIKKQKIV